MWIANCCKTPAFVISRGSTYRMFETSSLIAGSPLEFTLSGKPKQEGSGVVHTGSTQNLAIGLEFSVVLLGIGLWLYLQVTSARQLCRVPQPGWIKQPCQCKVCSGY